MFCAPAVGSAKTFKAQTVQTSTTAVRRTSSRWTSLSKAVQASQALAWICLLAALAGHYRAACVHVFSWLLVEHITARRALTVQWDWCDNCSLAAMHYACAYTHEHKQKLTKA